MPVDIFACHLQGGDVLESATDSRRKERWTRGANETRHLVSLSSDLKGVSVGEH